MKFLPVIILFISSVTLANEDPCERTDYPVTTVKEFKTLADNSFPSVYRQDNNSKVTVTVLKLKSIIEKEMRSHRPYLKKAKEHLLSSLQKLSTTESINEKELWLNASNMNSEEQQVASHVMAGIQEAFVIALFTESAFVEVNNQPIKKLQVRFLEGVDEAITTHEHNKVKNIRFVSDNTLIFQKCWLAK